MHPGGSLSQIEIEVLTDVCHNGIKRKCWGTCYYVHMEVHMHSWYLPAFCVLRVSVSVWMRARTSVNSLTCVSVHMRERITWAVLMLTCLILATFMFGYVVLFLF